MLTTSPLQNGKKENQIWNLILYQALLRILGSSSRAVPPISLTLPLNLPAHHPIPTVRKYLDSLLFYTLRMRRRSLPGSGVMIF